MNFHTTESLYEHHIKGILKELHGQWQESGSQMAFADWLELRDNASLVAMAFLEDLFDWAGSDDLETLINE